MSPLNCFIVITALLGLPQMILAQPFFGYVAVACGHDDPFDVAAKTDDADEVAGFTKANHLCLPVIRRCG
jgi:hypothetical protein